jgi:hypothetical protein
MFVTHLSMFKKADPVRGGRQHLQSDPERAKNILNRRLFCPHLPSHSDASNSGLIRKLVV